MRREPSSWPPCRKICPNTNLNGCYLSVSMVHPWKTSLAVRTRFRRRDRENRPQIRNRSNADYRRVGGAEAFCAALRGSTGADRRPCRFQSLRNRWTDTGSPSQAKNEWRLVDVYSGLEDWDIDCGYVRDLDQPLLCIAADRRGT